MENEEKINELVAKVNDTLDNWDNDDAGLDVLDRASEYFCSNWDLSEGYKHAIRETLNDQFNNHKAELEVADLERLLAILNVEDR